MTFNSFASSKFKSNELQILTGTRKINPLKIHSALEPKINRVINEKDMHIQAYIKYMRIHNNLAYP